MPASAIAPPERPAPSGATVSLSEVLGALSHALDLTEGQPMGHTVRSCLIGMRIAGELALDADQRSALYYALLLKDAGCSSNAARMCALFGSDDGTVKRRMKRVDWHDRVDLAVATARMAAMGGTVADRVRQFAGIARTDNVTRDLMQVRCERGAEIAGRLGFPETTAAAIRALDEPWCGRGYPRGLAGEEIPLLARICNLAQVAEVFLAAGGVGAMHDVARERRGRWFDPALVDLLATLERDREWWRRLRGADVAREVVAVEPQDRVRAVGEDGLDAIAAAFADIIDAKTPFTYHHSSNVARYAVTMGERLGDGPAARRRLLRAGLLHDVGKLGVSNRILDKPGRLTPAERRAVELHPFYTWQILSRVGAFADLAWTASLHHETLGATGYPWKVGAASLDRHARILAVADIHEALTADRPYRAGMTPDASLAIIRKQGLCGEVVDVLAACVDEGAFAGASA